MVIDPGSPLAAWDNFYLITGPSGAALTGLQFVAVALLDDSATGTTLGVAAFATPTILHFSMVLALAGILTAPWIGLAVPAFLVAACAVAGMGNMALAGIRARRQSTYQPILEDWFWYTGFPFVAYLALLVGAIALPRHPRGALFGIATIVLLLLFIGIRNAWDTVIYIGVSTRERRQAEQRDAEQSRAQGPPVEHAG